MKKGYKIIIICLLIGIFFIIMSNTIVKNTRSNNYDINSINESNLNVYENKNSLYVYKDNYIYIKFDELNKVLNGINNYLDYDDSLKNIYNKIIDSYYQKDKIKMYKEKKNQILEIKLTKDESKTLFSDFYNGNNIIIKVSFDKNTKFDEFDLESVRSRINREEVIRENIVATAKAELNNTGEKFWEWYGFNRRVEWCCVFVSWVADQNDVLETKIPKFIWVKKGVDYYKEKNQLKSPREYTPRPGDIIFFNWNSNPIIDHVGLVEKVEKGYVYTIEGNVEYKYVKRKKYKLNSPYIYAYGVPDYAN